MNLKIVVNTLLLITVFSYSALAQTKTSAFKAAQLKNQRVKDAYDTKWDLLKGELTEKKFNYDDFEIYMRTFKYEKVVEIWLKGKSEARYRLFKTYDICSSSGDLGPKRKEGDGQVPEGFYKIDLFNPKSDYYLSMRINYPNSSDILLKEGVNAGGAIMMHGECVTIGCLPMTNDKIKELYVLCLEAKNRNSTIYIDIYPTRFTEENIKMLEDDYPKTKIAFWRTLKPAYDYFETNHWLPKVSVDGKGKYFIDESQTPVRLSTSPVNKL